MRAVIQRVSQAQVSVDNQVVAQIGLGLVVLLGVSENDTPQNSEVLADKIAKLRIMADEKGKMNRSILEVKGEVLVVSQFTLYADTSRGRKPSFVKAAPPELAERFYHHFVQTLENLGVQVQMGRFGAYMQVELVNDGPVTLVLES